jgi:hypothetical protein
VSPIRPLSHLSKCTFTWTATRNSLLSPYLRANSQAEAIGLRNTRWQEDVWRRVATERTPGVWRLRAWKPDPVTRRTETGTSDLQGQRDRGRKALATFVTEDLALTGDERTFGQLLESLAKADPCRSRSVRRVPLGDREFLLTPPLCTAIVMP